MTVGDLFLIINIISLILILSATSLKKIELFPSKGTIVENILTVVFMINALVALVQGIFYLLMYWNYKIGF